MRWVANAIDSIALGSMEFHETAQVIEIGAHQVPRNSIEFHGTARVSEIEALQVPWNSMEFHGTAHVSEIGAPQVHGIPWNCSCHRNWRTPSSIELLVFIIGKL